MRINLFKTLGAGAVGLGILSLIGVMVPGAVAQTSPSPCSSHRQDFAIYFEANNPLASRTGIQVLEQALANVQAASHCKITSVRVTGHQDRAGSADYNKALSAAMMYGLVDEMIARGVSADIISAEAKGEGDMAYKTKDGVREPLNRRVEILITMRSK